MPDDQRRVWTIRDLMKSAIDHFQHKGFEEARLNVELLLSHALELQRIQLYVNYDKPLTAEELKVFRLLCERRLKHEPLQYITGFANFMGLQFAVDRRVLIPRPETETLIEQAMLYCQRFSQSEQINILEIGTGSGNIAISLAKYIKNAYLTTIDKSSEALLVAKENAIRHGVESRIKFLCFDVFDNTEALPDVKYNLILSNPPYVPEDEWDKLQIEVHDYEPIYAITDGKDGYRFYNRINEIIHSILKLNSGVILEIGFGQAEKVLAGMANAGLEQLKVTHDLQGVPRVVSGIWTGFIQNTIGLN